MTRNMSAATKIGLLSLLVVLAVAGYVVTGTAFAAPSRQGETLVSIQPAAQTIQVGETTTVDVQIQNVDNLFGIDLRLTFDPSIVNVVDSNPLVPGEQVEPGAFLDISEGKGFVVDNSADNTTGEIAYIATLLSPASPVSGSGTLIRITFEGVAEGTSPVTLESVLLSDAKAEQIPATTEDGSITVEEGGGDVTVTPEPVGNVVISGTVQDCRTGAGVGGATVRILEAPENVTVTDANGNYVIVASLVLPAEYTIQVDHPNFFSPTQKGTGLIQQAGKDQASVVVNFTGVDCLKPKPTPSPTATFTPTPTPLPTITPTPTRRKPQTLLILDGAGTFCDGSELREGAAVEIVTSEGGVVASQPVSHRGEYFFYEDFQGLEGIYWIRFRFPDGGYQYLLDANGTREFELIDTEGDGDIDADDLFIKENMRQLNFVGVNCVKVEPPAEPPVPPKPPTDGKPDGKPHDGKPHPDGKYCIHVVRYGETLFSIARRYGSTVYAVAMANGIYDVNYIRPGMKLIIPNCHVEPSPPQHPPVDCVKYIVKPGDTLYSIARRHGTSVYAIAHANNIVNPWYIRVGMKLIICPKPGYDMYPYDHPDYGQDGGRYHVVKPGDTLYSIAVYYGVAPQAIEHLNHLSNPHALWPGQRLRLP